MAQADGVVANGSGSAVRADINAQLAAAFTNHSGSTQPSTTYAYQNWIDTSSNVIKIRNSANSGYVSLRTTDGKTIVPDGTKSAPSLYFSSNTDVGIFYDSLSSGSLSFTRNGVAHAVFGRTLENQTDAFVFGPAAYRSTALNPTNGNNDSTATGFCIANDGTTNIGALSERPLTLNRMGTDGRIISFHKDGTDVGGVRRSGSTTSYETSSDYRLKENIVDLTGAKARLNQFEVKRFNFIGFADGTVDGFLAHEVQAIVPEAVSGVHDEVDGNGDPVYQCIDQGKLVPLLTAALQEAFAEIDALRTRVETLEAS